MNLRLADNLNPRAAEVTSAHMRGRDDASSVALRRERSARGRASQAKGRKFEARVRRYYSMPATAERLGHEPWTVVRSAGSLGVVDLVAMRAAPMYHTEVHWLSCRTNGKWSRQELAEFIRDADRVRAKPMLAYREDDRATHFRLVVVDANERLARMMSAVREER